MVKYNNSSLFCITPYFYPFSVLNINFVPFNPTDQIRLVLKVLPRKSTK